jgi:hypothetical protein
MSWASLAVGALPLRMPRHLDGSRLFGSPSFLSSPTLLPHSTYDSASLGPLRGPSLFSLLLAEPHHNLNAPPPPLFPRPCGPSTPSLR